MSRARSYGRTAPAGPRAFAIAREFWNTHPFAPTEVLQTKGSR